MDRNSWLCAGDRDQDHPQEKEMQKSKMTDWEREVKSKGEKERYALLSAEFQRTERRDKKAFLSDQCKEIEENNRMGKTRDLFKEIQFSSVQSLSRVQLFATMWTVAYQAPPSMGFSQQEYRSELPVSFSRLSSWPRDRTHISWPPALAGAVFSAWVIGETQRKP